MLNRCLSIVEALTKRQGLRGPRRPLNAEDTGYGRIEKAKTISADNPARYFPASDEQIGGPFSAEKYRTWFASLDSAV
jgi:hypothetical protein